MQSKIIVILTIFLNISGVCQTDFQKYFDNCKVKGSISIYNTRTKKWIISDSVEFKKPTTPASTFKIPNSIIALKTGVIKDENEIIKWDGVKRNNPEWDKDTDFRHAFKNSTVWFYQELARRIGIENYKKYLKEFDYGNQQISKVDTFWLDESLQITPEQEIKFLRKFFSYSISIPVSVIEKVKDIMTEETTDSYTLRCKTGWGTENKNNLWVGWWVGWVKTDSTVYYFATRIYKNKNEELGNFLQCRKDITKQIFRDLGLVNFK